MSDLATWLLEQIDADEQAALVARDDGPGSWRISTKQVEGYGTQMVDLIQTHPVPDRGYYRMGIITEARFAAQIVTWDPARVLAECAAKRRVIEWHKSWPVLVETPPTLEEAPSGDVATAMLRMTQKIAWLTEQEYRKRFGTEPPAGPVLAFLALPYVDRPGYRDEWRL